MNFMRVQAGSVYSMQDATVFSVTYIYPNIALVDREEVQLAGNIILDSLHKV